MKKFHLSAVILMVLIISVSCTDQTQQLGKINKGDPVIARVDQSDIYKSQLDAMLERFASGLADDQREQLSQKILEGIVRTRSLADDAEKEMTDGELLLLNARVQSYRDELLVQRYIQKNIVLQPATVEMVKKYYQDHLDDYKTAGRVKFEYLITERTNIEDDLMTKTIKTLSLAKNEDDWEQYAKRFKEQGIPLEYKTAHLLPAAVGKEFKAVLAGLKDGEVSNIITGQQMAVIRLIAREADKVTPLHQVSTEIRKLLAPQRLKMALKSHLDNSLKHKKIEYINR